MRRRIALALSWIGGVLAISAVAIYGIGLWDDARASSIEASAVSREVPPSPVATLEDPGAAPSPSDVSAEAVPSGASVYDRTADPNSINYPADMSESELANARIWVEQQFLIAECMHDQGYEYTWVLWWERGPQDIPYGSVPTADPGEALALYGNTGAGLDYRWQDAGCHGAAVHATGQDHAN